VQLELPLDLKTKSGGRALREALRIRRRIARLRSFRLGGQLHSHASRLRDWQSRSVHFFGYDLSTGSGGRSMWLEDHFGNGSLQRNERVKLAASFWNNVGAGMVIGGMAAAFFLDKPQGAWTKIGIAIGGLLLGWVCYSIASNILTYMHTVPDERL
jgi:hypothetical protein